MDDKRRWKQPNPARYRRIFTIVDPINTVGENSEIFQLTDIRGDIYSLAKMPGRITVLYFWSAECEWCERVDHELMECLDRWKERVKVLWIAVNANESRFLIERIASERNLPTVLLDDHQQVADLYKAEMTPHFFIVDANGRLAYQGSWDDTSFRQRVATQAYVPDIVEALLQCLIPRISRTPAYGCVLLRYSDENS
jgi:peroxiredoxin